MCKKENMVVYKDSRTGMTRVPVDLREKAALNQSELEEIVRIAQKVEDHLDMPQDMEWVFDRDLAFPENLIRVQTSQIFPEKRER